MCDIARIIRQIAIYCEATGKEILSIDSALLGRPTQQGATVNLTAGIFEVEDVDDDVKVSWHPHGDFGRQIDIWSMLEGIGAQDFASGREMRSDWAEESWVYQHGYKMALFKSWLS
jgi:hypothetical protein